MGSNPTLATSNMKESDWRKGQSNRKSVHIELEGLKKDAERKKKKPTVDIEFLDEDISDDAPPLPPILND